jgi:PDZ domain-containing protein
VDQKQPAPFDVKFDLDRIGGPSAGLMFTLGVIDKVDPADLTGGVRVAGTGTIDDEGNVGPIGGVAQKLRGAKRDKATVFLTPAANCTEAAANAVRGLTLVRVATIDDALEALHALQEKRPPPRLCTR